jgi:2-methylcitrate dehydratase PrpD
MTGHTTTTTGPEVTAAIARFVSGTTLSADVERVARRALATALPLAVGAVDQPAPAAALRVTRRFGRTDGPATVLGATVTTSPALAALVNGTAANSDDFDDTDLLTQAHPSASVVPAARAVAEQVGADLGATLRAIAVGTEIATRLARTFGVPHTERGWHISSTSNQVGAGAAAAALLGLSGNTAQMALGLSATQAGGIGAALGSMAKPFHFGKAASNGVEAALLAAGGFTSPLRGIEGRRGLIAVIAPHADAADLLDGLGERWDALEIMPKAYPCGFVAHPSIDAAIELHGRIGGTDTIDRVEAHVHELCGRLMDRPQPAASLEAKLSTQYVIAHALRHGLLGLAAFEQTAIDDPATRALAARVTLVPDQATTGTAVLTVTTASDEHRAEVRVGRGTPERPLTDEEVAAKGVEAAARTVGEERATALVEGCLGAALTTPISAFRAWTVPS